MTIYQRLLSLLLAAAMLVSLAACGNKDEQPPDENVAMGRYIEQEWQSPELPENWSLTNAFLLPDGRIAAMATQQAEPYTMRYFTTSDGAAWTEETPAWFTAVDKVADYIRSVDFNSKGEGFVSYMGAKLDGSGERVDRVARIGADGTLSDTAIGGPDPWLGNITVQGGTMVITDEADETEDTAGQTASDTDAGATADTDTAEEVEAGGTEAAAPAEDTDTAYVTAVEGDFTAEAESAAESTEAAAAVDGTEATEEATEATEATAEEPEPYVMPLYFKDVLMGEDGMAYISTQFSGAGKFDPENGEMMASYIEDASAFAMAGDEAVQLLSMDSAERAGHTVEANSLFFSDASSGALGRTLPSEDLQLENGVAMAGTDDGSLYIANRGGLARVAPGGEIWEKLLDGNLCSLSMPSLTVNQLIPHGDGEFIVVFFDGSNMRLFNYLYSEDTPTLPDSELTVFSMTDNRTVSQALGAFRQKYPNTLVNIRTANDTTEAGNGDDARAALNTEILAGKGPDVFVLENLPVESYIEKGVLADLSGLVNRLLESDSILPAVTEAYANDDGIFAIPARVILPTLWGSEEAVAAANDLDSLLAYAKSHPEARMFGNMTPEHLLYQLAPSVWNSLLKDGAVDPAAVEKLLTAVIALSETAEKPHFYNYFGTEAYLTQTESTQNFNFADDETGIDPEDFYGVANNHTALMPAYLNGFMSVMLPNGVINKRIGGMTWDSTGNGDWKSDLPEDIVDKVFRPFPDSGLYEPACVVGVNAAGTQQELAMAFIEAVLSPETQSADLDGFPVNREALAAGVARHLSWYTSHGYTVATDGDESFPADEMVLEYAWPSEAVLQAVADQVAAIKTPMLQGYSLPIKYAVQECLPLALKMVTDGGSTPGEAAAWLAEELSLMAEE